MATNDYFCNSSKFMKHLFIFFIAGIFCFSSCKPSSDQKLDSDLVTNPNEPDNKNIDVTNLPVIKFDTTEHDFGAIKEGEKPTFTFYFVNAGKSNLIISDVHPSCGCTSPSWPHGVIKPKQGDGIKIEFNSKGKSGEFRKTIMVTANTFPNKTVLVITGTVYPQ